MNQGACKYRQPGLVFSLLLLLLLSACGQPALSSPSPTPSGQLQTFPDTGPPGLPFYDPQGLCLDPQNNLYVADGSMDRSYYRLLKLSPGGQILAEWHYFQPAPLGNAVGPIGLACDTQGNIYVDNAGEGSILRLSSTGQHISTIGKRGQFVGINIPTLDASGNLFISEYDNSRIEKFSSSGQLLATIDLPPADKPAGPIGIAVEPAGTLYVADQRNDRVLHLSAEGKLLQIWGKQGSKPGQFDHPGGLALDSKGNVYIGDDYNYRIQKFSSQGKVLAFWPLPRKNTVSLNTGPGPMAIGAEDNLYVSDTDANITTWHILRFSPSGTLLSTI